MSRLTILEVAKLKGVSCSTLRRWEVEGLVPERRVSGHRWYDFVQLSTVYKAIPLPVPFLNALFGCINVVNDYKSSAPVRHLRVIVLKLPVIRRS